MQQRITMLREVSRRLYRTADVMHVNEDQRMWVLSETNQSIDQWG